MYKFIDLCCGFGSLTKAFERTGLYECVLAADIDQNMRNHYNFLLKRMPLGDITSDEVRQKIKETPYDILTAGIGGLSEIVFFEILETIERDQPKAFVIEMSPRTIHYSMCNILDNFCRKHEYHFIGFENRDFGNITLNLENFGVPNFHEKMYCVCVKKEFMRTDDELFCQLQKEHDYRCYEHKNFDPDKHPEHLMGTDWGFGGGFYFLLNTPQNQKKRIIEESSPIPVAASVALSLGLDFIDR